jgi:hypothetical protein
MTTHTYAIKGAYFRPPAKALLDSLPVGTPLTLLAEPDNEFDPNAIQVFLASANVPSAAHETLRTALGSFGSSLEDILDIEWHHCGYIPKEHAAELRSAGFPDPPEEIKAEFTVSARGAPLVRFDF